MSEFRASKRLGYRLEIFVLHVDECWFLRSIATSLGDASDLIRCVTECFRIVPGVALAPHHRHMHLFASSMEERQTAHDRRAGQDFTNFSTEINGDKTTKNMEI